MLRLLTCRMLLLHLERKFGTVVGIVEICLRMYGRAFIAMPTPPEVGDVLKAHGTMGVAGRHDWLLR